jgi:thiamine pyrophosphate-dependent acetolactate synthase large subunit-like protein
VAKGFEIEGGRISGPDEIKTVFERAFAVNREGRPFLIDAQIAQRGPGADLNWHPGVSIGARS